MQMATPAPILEDCGEPVIHSSAATLQLAGLATIMNR
jgi:hypothetical protein